MNREKWYEVTFFTNKPKEAIERLGADFTGKIDNLKVTEIKSQIEPMNREKLEARINSVLDKTYFNPIDPILSAIDAYVAEVLITLGERLETDKGKEYRFYVEKVVKKYYGLSTYKGANIHPSATHRKEVE